MTSRQANTPKPGGFLDTIERFGNSLPNPITLFVLLALGVLALSMIAAALGWSVVHPKDGSTISAVSLLDRAGIQRIFTEAIRNFMGFAPLGTVLSAMIGIGVAERGGLVPVLLRATVMNVPRKMLTATIVFVGVNANLAADAGIVLLPPIAAMLFAAVGRHPLAGIAAAFAGVAGGFSANLLPSTLDVLLAGFTQEAVTASRLFENYQVQVLGNYWFLAVSTPFLTVLGTWVTHQFVEPRLGPWRGDGGEALESLTPAERRGLLAAGIATLVTLTGFALLAVPASGPLRGEGATLLEQLDPFFDSMVLMVLLLFLIPGLAYGIAAGTIRNDHDVATMTGETMGTMGGYIVLAFAASQFIAWFSWSNLGAIVAISGAQALKSAGFQGGLLLAAFVLLTAVLDMFMASATAKWAIMAPVFVPMFALLGFTPEATQVVYRIGDSSVNIISPLMPYMPFILAYAQRYAPRTGMGTLITMMLPYSIVFLVMWTLLLLAFYWLGWPIGPGVGIRLAH